MGMVLPHENANQRHHHIAMETWRRNPEAAMGGFRAFAICVAGDASCQFPSFAPVCADYLGRQESMPGTSDLIDDEVGSDSHARQITHVRGNDEPEHEEDRACDRRLKASAGDIAR
jgi:hypothetical protein